MLEIESYCLAESARLHLRKADARWMIRVALASLPVNAINDDSFTPAAMKSHLREALPPAIRQRYGNPIVVFILLKIILPIVVNLVIKWIMRERNAMQSLHGSQGA